jgi:nucleoside-diphosphate-sugar epimerase
MVILVTGGSGFIGTHLLYELTNRGEKVVSLSRRISEGTLVNQVIFEEGDVRYLSQLLDIVKKYEVDRIIHTASLLTNETQSNPFLAFDVNAKGTLNMLEVARVMDIKRFVYISGSSVYGVTEIDIPVKEDHPRVPVTLYGTIKVLCEDLCKNYFKNYGLDWAGIRYPMVYGPGRERGFLSIQQVIADAVLKRHVVIPRGGDQKYAPVHVLDAVNGLILATFKTPLKSRIFNIGPEMDRMYSLHDIAGIVKKYVSDVSFEIGPGEVEEEPLRGPLDITKAKEELNYNPQYHLENGVKEFIEILTHKNA